MTTPVLHLQPARRIQTAYIEKNGTGIEKNGTGIFCRRRVSGDREQSFWLEKAVAAYAHPTGLHGGLA